jgi:hypothetical protein
MKTCIVLLLLSILYVNCDGGYMDGKKSLSSKKGTTTGYGGGVGTGGGAVTPPTTAPRVSAPGTDSEVDIGCTYSPPFDYSDELEQVMSDIHNCEGQPLATTWLIEAVRRLQIIDPRFGFMIKDGGNKIPRDIITYNWNGEGEGSNWFYVFDVVVAGCNNSPGDADYEQPAYEARVGWQFCNPDGYADNGYWSYDP